MSKTGATAALLMSLLIVPVLLGVDSILAQDSTKPPTDLKLVGDHWTPWDPPEAGPDAYIIQKGDTLWDLAGKWLGDPYLWPQVWDENRYIRDSHWIYPGDPLVVPGKPTVVSDNLPPGEDLPPDEEPRPVDPGFGRGEDTEEPTARALPPRPVPLLPVADETDIYCSGQITPEHIPSTLFIGGHELEKVGTAQGDVIYLNHGRDTGIQAGDEFAVIRAEGEVKHPGTKQVLGTYVRRLGRVRVLFVQERRSTALIEMSCEDIRDGDELVEWAEIPIPLRRSMPDFVRYDAEPSGGASGQVVKLSPHTTVTGEGHIVYTDLGAASGVQPGDALTIYRDNGELPRINLGQAVVLTVEPTTSTVKVTLSVMESILGDQIEVAQ